MNRSMSKTKCFISILIAFIMVATLISPLSVYAEPDDGTEYDGNVETDIIVGTTDDVERTIMAGSTEIESGVDIEYDYNRSNYYSPDSLEASSNNTDVLEVEISDYYDSGRYYLVLKGINPGTAILTLRVPRKEIEVYIEITVLPRTDAVFEDFPREKTLDKGESFDLKTMYIVNCGAYNDSIWLEDCDVTSSNTKAVTVTKNGDYCRLKAVGPGKSTITLTVNKENESKGLQKSFVVTVKQGPKATAPLLYKQINCSPYLSYKNIEVGFILKDYEAEYQIWRSRYPNKNFVKVATINVTEDYGNGYFVPYVGHYMDGGKLIKYSGTSKKYPVKPNTKYYYKIRVRHTDSYHSKEWSNFSKVRVYWTTPKPIANKKIKFNKSTRKVTIPKTKNVAGYCYTASNVTKLGYNIFGQPVYYKVTNTRTSSKRIFKVGNLVDGKRPEKVYNVIPYAKHGDYYYMNGYRPVKKLSVYKDWDAYSYVN